MSIPLSQHLDVAHLAIGIVKFSPSPALTTGSEERATEAMRLVRKSLRKAKCGVDHQFDHIQITQNGLPSDEFGEICSAVERKLEKLRLKPLSSRAVEEILSISSGERRRWSKDGRLPHVGNALIKLGKKQLSLFLYSPVDVQVILRNPDTVLRWRQEDIAHAGPSIPSVSAT